MEKYKTKMHKEEAASTSGISPTMTELDNRLQELTEQTYTNVQILAEEDEMTRNKMPKEKQVAQDMRLKTMDVSFPINVNKATQSQRCFNVA